MLKRLLNIGVSVLNEEALNRKIRISNLISIISIVTILGFLPLAISLKLILSLCLLLFLATASIINFILHSKQKHITAFYVYTIAGYIYFISSTLTFGLVSNLHFFLLVMCMIASVIFDSKLVIKVFIAVSIISFFTLRWYMKDKIGFINLPTHLKSVEEIVGGVILFLLFIITSVFFIFFKNENLNFQKAIIQQKEIIEEKNKDITASITYAKRIQESLLPTEKYIDKNLKRLKKD